MTEPSEVPLRNIALPRHRRTVLLTTVLFFCGGNYDRVEVPSATLS
ncbi:MAG: hypothetical protein WKF77_05180 [Planctomycetaceae bacterium]